MMMDLQTRVFFKFIIQQTSMQLQIQMEHQYIFGEVEEQEALMLIAKRHMNFLKLFLKILTVFKCNQIQTIG